METVPRNGIKCQKLTNIYHPHLPFVRHAKDLLQITAIKTRLKIQRFEKISKPKQVF